MSEPRGSAGNDRRPLSDEAYETSRLVVELVQASYALRQPPAAEGARGAPASAGAGTAMSPHAVRGAIHLYQHGERSVGEIAAGLGISYGWASRVVDELAEEGRVLRRRDERDRRVVRVQLSQAAIDEAERLYRCRGDLVERALVDLDDEGRRAVRTFLRRLVDEFEAVRPPPTPRPHARPSGGSV